MKAGHFKVELNRGHIEITNRAESVQFSPGEAHNASQAVSSAMRSAHFKALPPKIRVSPFDVLFSEDGTCRLQRDGSDKGCPFTFDEGDDLLRAIKLGVDKYTDQLKIRGGARPGVSSYNPPDPLIEGR